MTSNYHFGMILGRHPQLMSPLIMWSSLGPSAARQLPANAALGKHSPAKERSIPLISLATRWLKPTLMMH